MSVDPAEIQRRTKIALAAIKAAHGTEPDQLGVTLFVSHHLEEVDSSYWEKHFQTSTPDPGRILDSLVLCSEFEEEEDLELFDFTLPGKVTNYLICVNFNDEGEVESIAMES